jgi:thiol-disulfide isomerase/thioredoxin
MRVDLLARAASFLAGGPLPALGDRYLQRLAAEYPDAPMTRSVLARHGASRALQKGKTVPDFRFAALGDSTRSHTLASLRGRHVLLDFWATWCAPCIGEMPVLHAAHERFRSRGFEILSISADAAPAVVERFRAGRWPMPWLHTFAEGGLEHPTLKAFEIRFLPRTVLIDGEGRIVAVDDELRGERLAETLERVLGGSRE